MDTGSLENASTYLNNLLLARGLLRNGKPIEFAYVKKSDAGTDHTMARIINLVHDLVIRRDRDADQRETLATNIRDLHAEEVLRASEVERLQNENTVLLRNLANAEGQKRSLEASAIKTEARARELKEQMAKMKSTLDQVRAKCVNDIRKRDVELGKLKKHIMGMQRGAAHTRSMKVPQLNAQPSLPKNPCDFQSDVTADDSNWSLEKETNEFLAALVKETSTENVALRHIVGGTIETLKDLTGLNQAPEKLQADPEIGIPGQYKQSRVNTQPAQPDALVPCENLTEQMNQVLDHCRAILKDPSFVSIEEVQIREDEIVKLREGWEKMTNKWKDAVAMMDTFRKRMLEGGNSVDRDELGRLDLAKSVAVMSDTHAAADGRNSTTALFDNGAERTDQETNESEDRETDIAERQEVVGNALASPLRRLASSPARRGVRLPRPTTVFHRVDGNGQRAQSQLGRTPYTNSSPDSGLGSLDSSVDLDVHLEESLSEMSPKVRSLVDALLFC